MIKNVEDNKFTWNDVVKVNSDAPKCFHPGEIASICGMEKVKFVEFAQECHVEIGDWVYLVEFKDGSSVTIPEIYLEKI